MDASGFLELIQARLHEAGYTSSRSSFGLSLAFQLRSGIFHVAAIVHGVGPVLELVGAMPFIVDADAGPRVAEAVTEANFLLRNARLDHDPKHRRIVVRSFHCLADAAPTTDQIKLLVGSLIAVSDLLHLPMQDVCLRNAPASLPADTLRGTAE